MLRQIINAFLTNDNVGTRCLNFLNQATQIVFFFLEELSKHAWVSNLYLCIDFGFLDFNRCIDQCNLCTRYTPWHATVDTLFVEDDAID